MDSLEVQSIVGKLKTIRIDDQDLTTFLVYDNRENATNAIDALFDLFHDNELEIIFHFVPNMELIKIDEERSLDPDSTVSLTITDNKSEFIRILNIPITSNLTMFSKSRAMNIWHEENLKEGIEYNFAKLASCYMDKDNFFILQNSTGILKCLSNIKKITVLPLPSSIVIAPGSPTMIGPS